MNVLIFWGIIALLVFLLFFKMNNARSRFAFWLTIIGVIFIGIFVYFVFTNKNLDVSTLNGVVDATRVFFSWLSNAAHNVIKITGYAINQKWGVNSTA